MVFFISVVSSNEECKLGWDAKSFLYTISGLYFLETLLVIMQLRHVKTYYKDNSCLTFLSFVNLCTLVGFYISGNVGYYNNPDKSDC